MSDGIIQSLESKCEVATDHLKSELSKLRSGRASSGLLEGLTVEYYGSQVPLMQMGLVNAPEPRLLSVQVYDAQAVEAVEKAIRDAGLGLNPMREGSLLRIPIPALTDDRRKEMIKKLHKLGEDTKVTVRGHRRDTLDQLKKAEKAREISEDELHRRQESIQKTIDLYAKKVDEIVVKKETEMSEV